MIRQADVVVPVYADVEVTVRCLEAVLRHSAGQLRRLWVIDDASPEVGMAEALEELRLRQPEVIRVLRNERNLGFVGSANRGLALRSGDVVLLNSDTEVTAGWLSALLEALDSSPYAAAAVPLSNNATLCSVPTFCGAEDPGVLRAAELALADFPVATTEMPTGVGFCMLLRHAALEAVGLLDPAYGRGYNEENDWCMRARRAGYSILRANRALVFHLGGVSFGAEKAALDRRNARLLSQRYPEYLAENRAFAEGPTAHRAATYVAHRLGRARVSLQGEAVEGTAVLADALGADLAGPGERPELVHWRGERLGLAEVSRLVGLTSALVVDGPEPWRLGGTHRDPASEGELGLWALLLSVADRITAPSDQARQGLLQAFHLSTERVVVVPPFSPPSPSPAASPGGHWVLLGDPHTAPLDLVLTAQALLQSHLGALAPRLVTAWPTGWGEPPPGVEPLAEGAEMRVRLSGALAAVAPGIRGCSVRELLAALAARVPIIAQPGWGAEGLCGRALVPLPSPTPWALAKALEQLHGGAGTDFPRPQAWPAHPVAATAAALRAVYAAALERPDPAVLHLRLSLGRVLALALGTGRALSL